MNLTEIEKQAKALMTVHGVGRLDFEFDRAKKRIGGMHFLRQKQSDGTTLCIPKKITISKHYATVLTPEELHDVMLHEIAHALVPDDDHGPRWKAAARKIGAQPVRCKAIEGVSPEPTVVGLCPQCGTMLGAQFRLPLKVWVCGKCPVRNLSTAAVWYRKNVKVPLEDMPARYRQEYARLQRRGL